MNAAIDVESGDPRMHLRGLDLNLLVALDVLLDECNITRAAERLNLSQSGMSTALARLRDYFDDQLLVPMGRRMVPTPLGGSFVGPVREIVLQAQALIDRKPGFVPAEAKRSFSVVGSDYLATVFLPHVAQRIAREAPGVVLEVISHSPALYQPLERGDVDLFIMPEQYCTGEHPSMRLFSEDYVCISWAGNTRFDGDPDLATYLALGHVVARIGNPQGIAFDEWFVERFDQPRRVESVVFNFASIAYFVVGTTRLATLHRRMAVLLARSLPIRVHPLPFDMPPIVECLQWNRFSDRHPAIIWIRELMAAWRRNWADTRSSRKEEEEGPLDRA